MDFPWGLLAAAACLLAGGVLGAELAHRRDTRRAGLSFVPVTRLLPPLQGECRRTGRHSFSYTCRRCGAEFDLRPLRGAADENPTEETP